MVHGGEGHRADPSIRIPDIASGLVEHGYLVPEIAPRPVFFIHGELDETIPLEHAYRLQQASQNPQNQLWVVPGAGHVMSYVTHPEEYMNKITTFFDEVLR